MASIRSRRLGVKPFVVLKPCANETPDGVFSTRRGMYIPSCDGVERLVFWLNTIELSQPMSRSVDSKRPRRVPQRVSTVQLFQIEKRARLLNCNVLGATFLEFLRSFGYVFQADVLHATVVCSDREFFEAVYPIFEGYFETPRATEPELTRYLDGVVQNNSGIFTLVSTPDVDGISPGRFLRNVAFLKRVYRYAVKLCIPYSEITVRDNLVHSPKNLEELESHYRLFLERSI